MLDYITNLLIKRKHRKLYIPIKDEHSKIEEEFIRVLNTLRSNKIMVKSEDDGIYIRMAGNERKGECFSKEWTKVKLL